MTGSRLKAYFVVPFLTVMGILGIWSIFLGSEDPAWFGVALVALPVNILIGRAMMLKNVARTSRRLTGILILAVVGLCVALSDVWWKGDWRPGAAGAVGLVLLSIYVFWYSRLARGVNAILKVGSPLPPFQAESEAGEPVSSTSFLGHRVLFLFYRGNWCPL